jgi:hypothetical protein
VRSEAHMAMSMSMPRRGLVRRGSMELYRNRKGVEFDQISNRPVHIFFQFSYIILVQMGQYFT